MVHMTYYFHAVITQGKDGIYVARVPTLRGCHTQAKTLSQLHKRLPEAIELCLEVEQSKRKSFLQDKFIAVQEVAVNM